MRRALVVGLNDYEGSPLSCCANDAKEMGELLAKHDNENHNFDVKLIEVICLQFLKTYFPNRVTLSG